ncbi:alpha/beta fold hydrolase [Heliophilum fasciatum]|uniref:Pimeloyl-ACP methyl ester carboxylesterase n=1 Tax=Heliophilum fasciatum TaxID=35700 RepID=A0A4R2RXZ4_9FIRM|nr:alpha/beta hydrolase [Heliophilum fasciatum]MCW2277096.1 pimeloyl-ACP methyl ester carboxylesterase [Heliophilum fasciatum]TCP68378.1 pimeloyl-ACP methyl ester carboxylesterase [Heliophilum fasciatum]
MPYIIHRNRRIFFEERGDGAPLLLIHGVAVSHKMWAPQLAVLARSYRVIAPDLRGAGKSSGLSWQSRVADLVADLIALLDRLAIEQVAVCGLSFGGVVAQELVLRYPERCAMLVLVDTFSELRPGISQEGALWLATWLGVPLFLMPKRWMLARMKESYGKWPVACRCLTAEIPKIRGMEAVKMRWMMRGLRLTPRLAAIHCPCLGIVGGNTALGIALMRRVIEAIPGAKLRVVPHAFDPTSLCQPAIFNRLVDEFLAPWQERWAARSSERFLRKISARARNRQSICRSRWEPSFITLGVGQRNAKDGAER